MNKKNKLQLIKSIFMLLFGLICAGLIIHDLILIMFCFGSWTWFGLSTFILALFGVCATVEYFAELKERTRNS